MTREQAEIVLGGLLHDIGKVIYRQGDDKRKHSRSGYDFLKEEVGIEEDKAGFLSCVRYHHADALKNADIADDSIAYITYMADNIAAAADRRESGGEDFGFSINTALQSIFGILNGNEEDCWYHPGTLNPKEGINYPQTEKGLYDESFYNSIKLRLTENLKGLDWDEQYINSLLEVLEANLSFVPSSTAKAERADISLYDHLKLTAGISSCIYEYLKASGEQDFRKRLFADGKAFCEEKAFLMVKLDLSGIQKFIYTIASKNALKTLRVRSFYLEILMEHIIDELLLAEGLSRANLIYSGGGHCLMLFPNTKAAIEKASGYIESVNDWLLKTFNISLYVAYGYAECSANALKNEPAGSYPDIHMRLEKMLSEKKNSRYDARIIRMLNKGNGGDGRRECNVCRRTDLVDEEGHCRLCSAIESFSRNILHDDIFIISAAAQEGGLPLPGDHYLLAESRKNAETLLKTMPEVVRIYTKNCQFTGEYVATRVWVADYTTGQTFEEFSKAASGVERIAILRADVDYLGRTFIAGLKNKKNNDRYETISRYATLSRQLSMFFKLHLRSILENPEYRIGAKEGERKLTVCYSGGDDLFIVGAWDDVIEAAVDIRRQFEKYTRGTLTLSAGIALYPSAYPVSAAAYETAELEDASKYRDGKAAITLLPDGCYHKEGNKNINDGTYSWEDFEDRVIAEKYACIADFFDQSEDRGNAFLYRILELIRGREDKINFARCVYMLSRLEPGADAPKEKQDNFKKLSQNIYRWIQSEKDCRELKTAINMYVYMNRETDAYDAGS